MLLKPLAVFVAAAAAVAGLSVPHHHNARGHNQLAARLSAPRDLSSFNGSVTKRQRDSKRCRPRATTTEATTTSTPTPEPSSSPAPETPTPAPEPEPSPEPAPEPAPEPEPQPQPEQNNNNGGGGGVLGNFFPGTQHGQATFYSTGLNACGTVNSDSDFIAAASHLLFDIFPGSNGNPNRNPICGHRIRMERNGKSVEVAIVDRCEACKITDIDLSPSAFRQIADESEGRVEMTWLWI